MTDLLISVINLILKLSLGFVEIVYATKVGVLFHGETSTHRGRKYNWLQKHGDRGLNPTLLYAKYNSETHCFRYANWSLHIPTS